MFSNYESIIGGQLSIIFEFLLKNVIKGVFGKYVWDSIWRHIECLCFILRGCLYSFSPRSFYVIRSLRPTNNNNNRGLHKLLLFKSSSSSPPPSKKRRLYQPKRPRFDCLPFCVWPAKRISFCIQEKNRESTLKRYYVTDKQCWRNIHTFLVYKDDVLFE